MKTLKIVAVVVVVVALSIAGVSAVFGKPGRDSQNTVPHQWFGDALNSDDMAEVLTAHLQEKLDLTDEQKNEILSIVKTHLEERVAGMQERREQTRRNLQTTAADHQALFQGIEAQFSDILTEEQMQELRQIVADNWGHLLEMRAHVAEENVPERGHAGELLQELHLTLEQKKDLFSIAMKYREMHQETRKDMQGLRKQAAETMLELLNNDEFDEARVRQTFRESTAKLEDVVVSGAKMLSEMKAVLTPEQQTILQQKGAEFLEQMEARGLWGQRRSFRDRMGRHGGLFSFRFHQAKK